MKFIAIFFVLICSGYMIRSQDCSALLSQAEEAYRGGRFEEVMKISHCLGVYKSHITKEKYVRKVTHQDKFNEHGHIKCCAVNYGKYEKEGDTLYYKIRPRRMRMLICELGRYDSSFYNYDLGNFYNYDARLIKQAPPKNQRIWSKNEFEVSTSDKQEIKDSLQSEKKERVQRNSLSRDEQRRAYILLGKTYGELGVLPLSEYFTHRLIKEYPTDLLEEDETLTFQKIYDDAWKRTHKFSAGVTIGWIYTWAIHKKINREQKTDFKTELIGTVLLGGYFNYHWNTTWAASFNVWINNTVIEYRENPDTFSSRINFLHQEKQSWVKFPLIVKWNPLKPVYKNRLLDVDFLMQGGISFNYLTWAKANVVEPKADLAVTDFDVADGRNRFNAEILLGAGARFRFGRNYFTFTLNGAYGLRDMLKQESVESQQTDIYRTHQVVENNYRTFSGYWALTYALRFNTLKKNSNRMSYQANPLVVSK